MWLDGEANGDVWQLPPMQFIERQIPIEWQSAPIHNKLYIDCRLDESKEIKLSLTEIGGDKIVNSAPQ